MLETTAYLYAYFRGDIDGKGEVQQIHMAISRDGLHWMDLNNNLTILTSNLGTKGVRDPYLIRNSKNDKIYLIATDLDASEYGGGVGHRVSLTLNTSDAEIEQMRRRSCTLTN